MDDAQLDDRIRRRMDSTVPKSALLVEAAKLPSQAVRGGSPLVSTGLVIATVAVASAAFWLVREAPSAGSGGSAALDIGAGRLTARLEASSVSLHLTVTGATTAIQVAASSGGPSRPFVAQLVCGPDEPLSGLIVLFGYVGHDAEPRVEGLPSGQTSAGGDGAFLFVTDGSAPAGATWTVRSGARVFEGPVAFWGVRQVSGSSKTSACVVFDPSLEPEKP